MMQPKIAVVGSFVVGLTVRAPRFPVKGESLIGTDFDMGPGGKGSNQAVGAARLGAESRFVGVIGADSFGDMAVDLYRKEGVETSGLRRVPGRNTGVAFITLNAEGDNHIIIDPGANRLLSATDVDAAEETIRTSNVVMTVLEIPVEPAARAMQLGRRHRVTTIFNPAPATRLDDSVLAFVDVLTPNESELRILCGLQPDDPADTLELARRLCGRGVRNVIVTRGSQGALIVGSDGTTETVPAARAKVVDTTGAGDAFNAALGVSLGAGKSLAESVRFAALAGAFACSKLGVIPALPYPEDLESQEQTERSPS